LEFEGRIEAQMAEIEAKGRERSGVLGEGLIQRTPSARGSEKALETRFPSGAPTASAFWA